MKRLCAMLISFIVMLSICGCSKIRVKKDADITLTFIYQQENIRVALEEEEAEKVIAILDGHRYDPFFYGVPSCGFSKNISLKVGDRHFAIACDTCNCIQDLDNQRYFEIPMENMEYIRSLFEKYGGYFPCL